MAGGNAGAPARRGSHRWGVIVAVVASALIMGCITAGSLGATTALTGLPDKFFNTSVTYTPRQGPPNPILLDSRPDIIIEAYLDDYIRLAGTYPCAQDLARFDSNDAGFPLPCPVHRPVASYVITSVTIEPQPLESEPLAIVRFVMTYQDGTRWASDLGMVPDKYPRFAFFFIHLDCWGSLETLEMFGRLVPEIPHGAEYSEAAPWLYACQT